MREDGAPLALVVRFKVRAGSEEAFDRLTEEIPSDVREREYDTLIYACHTVQAIHDRESFTSSTATAPLLSGTKRTSTSAGSWRSGPTWWSPPRSTS
jgi:hypothetical protein